MGRHFFSINICFGIQNCIWCSIYQIHVDQLYIWFDLRDLNIWITCMSGDCFTNMIYKSSSCWTRVWIILAFNNSFLPVQHELMMILLIHTLGKIWMKSKHRKTSHIYQLMLKNWTKHDNALHLVYESCLDFIVWCLVQLTYNHIPYR